MKYAKGNKEHASAKDDNRKKSVLKLTDNRSSSVIQSQLVQRLTQRTLTGLVEETPSSEPAVNNNTGLPDNLKHNMESLSGVSLNDVKVRFNSSEPAQLSAHAFAKGNQIHIAPGQEKHLPHEAWHVVQQKQNRVKATVLYKGNIKINDDKNLESEADRMGAYALKLRPDEVVSNPIASATRSNIYQNSIIQRLGVDVGASDPGLTAEYNHLMNSAVFQKLNRIVTTVQNIILIDSSAMGGVVDYDPTTHTIRVPLTAGGVPIAPDTIRNNILWEMHNASIKGALNRSANKFFAAAPGPGATATEKMQYQYNIAAYALCIEWEEWMNVAEHNLKSTKINADPAMAVVGAGPYINQIFAPAFAVPDAGWFLFENYLRDQIATGHTAAYDANSVLATWKGKKIMNIAKSRSKPALAITTKQVENYDKGKTFKIKSVDNNPFKNTSIVVEASRGEL